MTRPRRRASVAVTGLLVMLIAGCSGTTPGPADSTSTPPPSSSSGSAPPSVPPKPAPVDPAAVNTADPEATAETVATAAVTWDTTVDTGDYDGIRRVAALLTPDLVAQLVPVEHPAPGPEWADATTKRSYNAPHVYTAEDTHGAPPDTAAAVYRAYTATWDWIAASGTVSTDPRTRTIYLTIALQPDGRWLVSTYDYTDL